MTDRGKVHGFNEAVFIVKNIEQCRQFYVDVIGWQVLEQSFEQVNPGLNTLWQLPLNTETSECLLTAPHAKAGFIRLVAVSAGNGERDESNNSASHEQNTQALIAQAYIRPNNQIWDVGGIFDVNTRVVDIAALAQCLHAYQWFGVSDPVPMHFGPFHVIEWLAKGHDGVMFACIERQDPPLPPESYPTARFSAIFNASLIVSEHQKEMEFFEHTLGFKCVVAQEACFEQAQANVFGLPKNIVNCSPHKLSMLASCVDENLGGSIEVVSFPQLTGVDVSHRAQPPNLGISTLRFPVEGLAAFLAHCRRQNVTIVNESRVHLSHYGLCHVAAIRSPQGTWLEFYQRCK